VKFNCDRSLLLNAVTIASRTVAQKSTISALEGLLLETGGTELTVTGYNLKTGIRTKLEAEIREEGRIVLSARLLGEIVRKMPEGVVSFSADDSLLVKLTCGMSYFEIMGIAAEEFPELPSVDAQTTFRLQEKKLQSMIGQTLFAVSTNESRPVHTGSLFEISGGELTVTSVDGYRLAQRREKLDEPTELNTSFVVPGSALAEAERVAGDSEEEAAIRLGARHILITIGDTEIISRRLEGEFLDYRKSVPTTAKYVLKADRRTLLTGFERVSLMINEKYKSPVRCRFEDGLLKLSAATALGKATDECSLEGDAGGLEIGFNNRYMLDALRAAPQDELILWLSGPTAPCVIKPVKDDGSFLYLILPVRIRTGE
jgi:DNA polymerase III, beta subunit